MQRRKEATRCRISLESRPAFVVLFRRRHDLALRERRKREQIREG